MPRGGAGRQQQGPGGPPTPSQAMQRMETRAAFLEEPDPQRYLQQLRNRAPMQSIGESQDRPATEVGLELQTPLSPRPSASPAAALGRGTAPLLAIRDIPEVLPVEVPPVREAATSQEETPPFAPTTCAPAEEEVSSVEEVRPPSVAEPERTETAVRPGAKLGTTERGLGSGDPQREVRAARMGEGRSEGSPHPEGVSLGPLPDPWAPEAPSKGGEATQRPARTRATAAAAPRTPSQEEMEGLPEPRHPLTERGEETQSASRAAGEAAATRVTRRPPEELPRPAKRLRTALSAAEPPPQVAPEPRVRPTKKPEQLTEELVTARVVPDVRVRQVEELRSAQVQRAEVELRSMEKARNYQQLLQKEIAYLEWRRRAYRAFRDDLWKWGILALRQQAATRGWGTVPQTLAERIVQCRRNRVDTRLVAAEVWALWPIAFSELDVEWDELYLAEFPEVTDPCAVVGDARWVKFYTPFTRDFFAAPTPFVRRMLGLQPVVDYVPEIAQQHNRVQDTDKALQVLGAPTRRSLSLERPLTWARKPPPTLAATRSAAPSRRAPAFRPPVTSIVETAVRPPAEVMQQRADVARLSSLLHQMKEVRTLVAEATRDELRRESQLCRELIKHVRGECDRHRRLRQTAMVKLTDQVEVYMARMRVLLDEEERAMELRTTRPAVSGAARSEHGGGSRTRRRGTSESEQELEEVSGSEYGPEDP